MDAAQDGRSGGSEQPTRVERRSDQEFVVTRIIDAPPAIVFNAWAEAEQFRRWWVPQSCGLTLLACELDVRVGGSYRLAFGHPASAEPFEVHGRYLEVQAPVRLVWTNEEAGGGGQVTTVTVEDQGGKTVLVMHDRYPSKAALDEAIASGATSGVEESLAQLAAMLAT